MFSWDDKTAGAQVLLAQLTGSGEYTSDVKNYFNYLKNKAKRTPKGRLEHFATFEKLIFAKISRILKV